MPKGTEKLRLLSEPHFTAESKGVTQQKMLFGGRCSTKAKQVGPASNSVAANPEQVASQSEQSRYKSEEKLIYLQKMS